MKKFFGGIVLLTFSFSVLADWPGIDKDPEQYCYLVQSLWIGEEGLLKSCPGIKKGAVLMLLNSDAGALCDFSKPISHSSDSENNHNNVSFCVYRGSIRESLLFSDLMRQVDSEVNESPRKHFLPQK